jgi:2-polyprenyl-6-methoxyphenol hydroxylase-like FAD-dependent oxidoreductase
LFAREGDGVAGIGRALIVGGGVAGMCCAIQLRKADIAVDLVDIDPEWRIYGAGITITGPTLRALRTVGVLDEVVRLGATWNKARVHNQAGEFLLALDQVSLAKGLPATGGVMRPILHGILSGKTLAMGCRVRLGMTVRDLSESADDVSVTFSDGSVSRYDLVVGADGIFSKLRQKIFPSAPTPQATGQVIYRLVAERPSGFDCTHFFMGADTKVGFNPVSATHMYMFLLHRASSSPRIEPELQPRTLHEAMAGFGGFVPQIRETVLTTNAHTINYRQLEAILLPAPWYRGRVVLIGDAAHATTPHLASGAGMAIEDGIVLVEELEACATLREALERFMVRRFERCRMVVENSVELGRIEMSHGSPERHAKLMTETLGALRQPI